MRTYAAVVPPARGRRSSRRAKSHPTSNAARATAARTAFEFAKAWLTGEELSLGENRKITVAM